MEKFQENWTLFVVLLTSGLLFRLIQIFDVIVATNCIGFYNFWLREYGGVSIYEAFISIFLLCSAWATLDFLQAALANRKNVYALSITAVMLLTAVLALLGTLKMHSMSGDIQSKLAADMLKPNNSYRLEYIGRVCKPLMPNIIYESGD